MVSSSSDLFFVSCPCSSLVTPVLYLHCRVNVLQSSVYIFTTIYLLLQWIWTSWWLAQSMEIQHLLFWKMDRSRRPCKKKEKHWITQFKKLMQLKLGNLHCYPKEWSNIWSLVCQLLCTPYSLLDMLIITNGLYIDMNWIIIHVAPSTRSKQFSTPS